MLPCEVAHAVAARLAATAIRQEARTGTFMDLCLSGTDREQVAEEMRRLAAVLDAVCTSARIGLAARGTGAK